MKKTTNLKLCVIYLFFLISSINLAYSAEYKTNLYINLQENDSILEKEFERVKELYLKKEYAKGLKEAFKLYDDSKKAGNEKIEYLSVFLIGEIYRLTRNYEKSLIYYKKSIKLLDSGRDEFGDFYFFDEYARNLLRLGSVYQLISMNDSAIFYYEKLGNLSSLNDKVLGFQAASFSNLSGIYQKDTSYSNHFNKAIDYSGKAIKIHKKRNKKINEARALNNLANVYLMQGNFTKSKRVYFEGINLIEKDSSTRAIRVKAKLYNNLSWSMRKLKEYKAFDFQEISYNMENGLRDDETQAMLERVAGEYNLNNFRQEEDLKRQIVINQKQKAQRNTWILGITSFFIIVLLIFFLNQYKLRQKNLNLELSKKETASQIEVLNATLAGEETERKRISQELHDGVLGRLFGSRMGLGYLTVQTDTKTEKEYQKFLVELQSIEKEIREVSHKLSNTISSTETSFLNAVHQLLKEKSSIGDFEYSLNLDEHFSLKEDDENLEMNLFRILQESLQNILKHAKAKKVSVDFAVENKRLLVEIKDDGLGFDTLTNKKGIGLKNIQSRVEQLKGSIKISSEKMKGTLISINIPLV